MADSDVHTVKFTPPAQLGSPENNPPMLSPGGTSGGSPGSLEPGTGSSGTLSGPGGELSEPGGETSGPGGEVSGPGVAPVETTSAAMAELMEYASQSPNVYILSVEYNNPSTNPGPRLEEFVIKFNQELATLPTFKAVVNGVLIEKVNHFLPFSDQ